MSNVGGGGPGAGNPYNLNNPPPATTPAQSGNPYNPVPSGIFQTSQNNYPYGIPAPTYGLGFGNNTQAEGTNVNQIPVNVLDVRNNLSDVLKSYQQNAAKYLSQFMTAGANLPTVNLGNNFQGADQLNNSLHGGIDYFGNLGISQGMQNIGAQSNAVNRNLAATLGKNPGNASLLNALQGQNSFQSQLAGLPLISQAQGDTYQRALGNVNLQNNLQNLLNQTQTTQQGFNLQSILSGLQAQLSGMQPMTNLLDVLTNLQGQGRGVTSSQAQVGSRNFG